MPEEPRWMLFSAYFPPFVGGTPNLYRHLLQYFDQSKICVIMACPPENGASEDKLGCELHWATSQLPRWIRGQVYLEVAWIPRIVWSGYRHLKKFGATRILATVPDVPFTIAAWLIHK